MKNLILLIVALIHNDSGLQLMLTLITLYTPLKKCRVKDAPLGQSTGSNPNPPQDYASLNARLLIKNTWQKDKEKSK